MQSSCRRNKSLDGYVILVLHLLLEEAYTTKETINPLVLIVIFSIFTER